MDNSNTNLRKLYNPLPDEAITQHPTKTYLSSIKAVYVTDRFNDVFGIGKWQTRVQKEFVNHDTGMVVVKVIFTVPSLDIYYESFGGNDNGGKSSKNFDLGDAYKGATTDAITKIGSFLGVGIDVFKGKTKGKSENNQPQKPWLNIYKSKDKKELTPEMTAIYNKMKSGEYKNISDIRQLYAISKVNATTIEAWFLQLKNQSKSA